MEAKTWNAPVLVIDGNGLDFEVKSTRQAAEFLIIHWPEESRGWKHLAAQVACLDVLEGKRETEHARQSFEDAAREAGILVEQKAP